MRINFGVRTLLLSVFSLAVSAQDYRYDVYLDSDANAGTGCSVVTPAGTVSGVEARVRADITNVTVTQSTVALCQSGAFPAGGALPAPYAVGLNNGTGGADVIEMATPATLAPAGSNVPAYVVGWNGAATASDLLATTNGLQGGPPIIIGFPVINIPTLGFFGFGLLALVLAVFGLKRIRKTARASLAALGLLSMAGAVWAAGFAVDGQVADWTGTNPIATDPQGDGSTADTGIDLRNFYVAFENGTMYLRVDVSDVENQPPVANPVAITMLEDAAPQTVTLSATDPDGDPLTFAIQTNPTLGTLGAVTPINTTSASVVYTVNPNANGADSFTYVANDTFVNSAPATVSVTITPVNDAPSFTSANPPAVNEDAGPQMPVVATAIVAGPADESGQTIAFTISNNTNPALFAAAPTISAAGVLNYTPAANVSGTAQLTFNAQDNGGIANGGVDTSAPQTITVTVNAVNDAPVFTAGTNQTVLEDAAAVTVAGWATGISPGPADEAGQTLTFNVTANTNPGLFSVAPAVNPTNGNLTYTLAANANGVASISLTLSDNGGTANGGIDTSAAQTFTITVTAVNDAPSFTSGGNVTVVKDLGPSSFPGWATAISAGPADESGQALTFEIVSATNNTIFSAQPAVSSTGDLTFTVAANANGVSTVTLRLRDNGGVANGGVDVSGNAAFDITVTAVNDAPTFTAGGNQTSLEDAGAQTVAAWATAISAGPPDEVGQVLTFNVTANTNPTLFSTAPAINPANGNLTYTAAPDANGTASITITLSDNGGTANGGVDTSAPATFTITVTPVNDAPSFVAVNAPAVNEDAGPQTASVANTIVTGPANESGQTITMTITNNTNPGLFAGPVTISPAGLLSYTPVSDANGTAVLTLVAQDNGGTANGGADTSVGTQTTTVTVNAVNDAPVNSVAGPQTTNEDNALGIPNAVSVADVDLGAGQLQMIVSTPNGALTLGNLAGLVFSVGDGVADATMTFTGPVGSVNGAFSSLTYTPTLNFNGTTSISITSNDQGSTGAGGAQTDLETIAITVTAVNDPPVNTVPGPQAVGTGATLAFTGPSTISVADVDAATGAVTTTVTSTIGTFTITSVGGATVTGSGTNSVQVTDVLADLNATLQTLTFSSGSSGTGTITVNSNDNNNTGAGGAQVDTDVFAISVDSPPSVLSTTPANGAIVATTVSPVITFSEAVTVTGNWAELNCATSGIQNVTLGLAVADADPVFTLNPATDLTPGENCTLTVFAGQVDDDDTIDPPGTMVANHVVTFSVDAAPAVNTIVPANGATNIAANAAITITFSEAVAATGTAFTVECPAGSPAAFTASASPATVYTLTPNTTWPTGTTCTVTVVAGQINDVDTADPPANLAANFVSTFTTDAAPTITGGTPLNGATGVGTLTPVTYTFSENVDAGPGQAITVQCPPGTPIAGTITGSGLSTLTFTPSAPMPPNTPCAVTTVAANINDTDLADPPNQLVADIGRAFTTDAPPSVSSTIPLAGSTNLPANSTIAITFSESVNFDTTANAANTSFDFECPAGTPTDFTVVTASPSTTAVLNPLDASLPGQTCTLTVRALGIADSDVGDPPDNMAADLVTTYAFAAVANDDAYNVTPHLTLGIGAASPQGGGVLVNDLLGPAVITGFGFSPACTGTAPGAQLDAGAANGRLTLNANGGFSYEPPAAQANGVRTFCYTITGGDTANVVFTLQNTEFVWFVDAAAAAGGNGTQARPFQTIAGANAVDTTNDTIHVAANGAPYTANFTLLAGERFIGAGAAGTLDTHSGITPVAGSAFPALGGTAPTLTCTDVVCVTLGTGNMIRGLTIGDSGASGTDLAGNGFGALAVSELTLTGTGRALDLFSGTVNGTIDDINASSSATQGIRLDTVAGALTVTNAVDIGNVTGPGIQIATLQATGNVNFAGGVNINKTSSGVGLSLTSSVAGANFLTNTVAITTGAGSAWVINNGANVTLTGSASTLNATGGSALDATNVTFVGGATFATVNATNAAGAADGVNLDTITGALNLGTGAISHTGGSGIGFDLNGGSANVTYAGTVTSSVANRLVEVTGRTGGTTTLSGNLTGTAASTGIAVGSNTGGTISFTANTKSLNGAAAGVSLTNNTGASIVFSGGGLAITTSTATGFAASGGATSIEVTGANNTIASTGVRGLDVSNSNIGAAGITFRSINVSNGVGGIRLDNTGAGGGLTVTGGGNVAQGGNNSGGTIQGTSGDAISLTNTRNVSLTNIRVQNIGTGPADQSGAIDATNLAGTNLLQASRITGMGQVGGVGGTNRNGINIINTDTALTSFTANNNVFTDSDGTSSFLFTSARGVSPMSVTVTNNDFSDLVAVGVQINAGDTETGVHTVTSNVSNNVFRNASPADGQGGIVIASADQESTASTTVTGNQLFDLIKGIAGGNSEILVTQTTGGAMTGTVSTNTIGTAAFGNGDRRGIGIIAEPDVTANGELGSVDVIHDGNIINRLADREAIFVDLREDTGNSELIVRNNNIGNLAGFVGQVGGSRDVLDIQTRGEVPRVFNTHITNNNITGNLTGPFQVVNLESNIDNATPGDVELHATFTGNTINNTGATSDEIWVRPRDAGTVTTVCVDMTGNTIGAGAGRVLLDETTGEVVVEQASAGAVATANGIPGANVVVTGAPAFATACLAPPL